MQITFEEIAKEIIEHRCYLNKGDKKIGELCDSLKPLDNNMCLLVYIVQLLKPISEEAKRTIENRHQDLKEKRKKITKNLREGIRLIITNQQEKCIKRILRGIDDWLMIYIRDGDTLCYYRAKFLLAKPIKDWSIEDVTPVPSVGKKTLQAFEKYLTSKKEQAPAASGAHENPHQETT